MSKARHYRFFAGMSLAIDIAMMVPFLLAAVLIVAFLLGANPAGAAGSDGIKSLITVTQTKSQDAEAQQRDSLDDAAATEQMRQQQNLERRSKVTETTSNMLKKHSDVQQQIIQNIK